MDHHHYVYFKKNRLCRFHVEGRTLIITEFSQRELFFIKLYISSLFKRNDFDSSSVVYDERIEYSLKPCDIIVLTKKGFPYSKAEQSSGFHFIRHECLVSN